MPKPTPPPRAATPKDLRAPPNAGAAVWKPPPRKPPPPPTGPARPPPPPTWPPLKPPPPKPPPPPPWGPAHAAEVSAIDVMPTRLSNLNFFILKDRYASVSRPLHMRGFSSIPQGRCSYFLIRASCKQERRNQRRSERQRRSVRCRVEFNPRGHFAAI